MLQGSNGRGVHPKLRSSSVRAFLFDEDQIDGLDMLGNPDLGQYLALARPGFLDGADVGGQFKRFNAGASQSLNTSIADILGTLLGTTWTMHMRVRWRSNAAGQTLIHIGGDDSDETAAHNVVFRLVNTGGNYRVESENLLGIDAGHTFTNYTIRTDVWHLVTVRIRAGVEYELFINGRLVETSPTLTAPTGGGSASMMLGATRDTASVVNPADVDVGSLHIYDEQLALDDIKQDARRANMLGLHSVVHSRVDVEDPSGAMQRLDQLEGVDWTDEFSVTRNVDDPIATCSVTLQREVGNLSLAYLKTDTKLNLTDKADPSSYDPLLDILREIECFAARVPLFITPVDDDWQSVFFGNIDNVDWSGDRVKLSCRDSGGRLVDTYIEDENDLGVGATQTLEATIQGVLTNNDSSAKTGSYPPVTLYTPIPSTWVQKIQNAQGQQLKQRREPVMSASRTHAGQIGWDTKYKWDPSTSTWRFTLDQPDRSRLDTDLILDLEDILNVQQLKINAQRVRSDIRIVYPSSEETLPAAPTLPAGLTLVDSGWLGVDGEGNRTFAYVHVANTGSRTRYGRRFFEIAEAATSMIDTIDEATDMAVAIAQDIGEPEALYSIDTPSFFEVDENGMLNLLGNQFLHTGQQHLAVRSLTHTFGRAPKSTFAMRGKPSVGFKRWLQLGTYPGQARPPTLSPFNTLDDMTVGQLVPFVTGLIEKTAYFGNTAKFGGLRNSTFSSSTRGSTNAPDNWSLFGASAWNTNYRYEDVVTESGGQSVAVLTTLAGGAGLRSDLVPLPKGDNTVLALEWSDARGNIAGPSAIDLGIFWYDEDRVLIGAGPVYNRVNTSGLNVFVHNREDGIVPLAGAKYAQVIFVGNAVNLQAPHYVDSVNLYEVSDEVAATLSTPQTDTDATLPVVNGAWTQLKLDTETRDYGGAFDTVTHTWTCDKEGAYDMTAGCRTFGNGLGLQIDVANVKLQFEPAAGGGFTDLIVGQGGVFDDGAVNAPVVNSSLTLSGYHFSKGDKIRAFGYIQHSGGAPTSFGFASGDARTYFTSKLRQTE